MFAVALAGWWWTSRSGTDGDVALHRFETADIHSLAFDLADPDTVFFGHHDGIMLSRDAGLTWQDGALRGVDVMQQAVGLADPPRHYVAGHDVLSVSIDSGQTWRQQSTNLPSLDLHTFAGSPADPNRLYAVPAGLGLFTSADGGATWTEAALPPGAETQPIALVVVPNDPNTLYLARNGDVAVSHDAGETWQAQPGPGGLILALVVAPDVRETLYAGTNSGLLRREPDGNWTRLPVEPDGMVVAVAISPAQPERVAIIDQRGNFYRSDNGGLDWVSD
ncbi:MAG: hypothetical protein M3439_05490 [Chloroflexota bacterium]|nr:hypothetical protein [Chloroflexota bacterium]